MWKLTNNLVEVGHYWTGGGYKVENEFELIHAFRLLDANRNVLAYGKCSDITGYESYEPLTALSKKYGAVYIEYAFPQRIACYLREFKITAFLKNSEVVEATL